MWTLIWDKNPFDLLPVSAARGIQPVKLFLLTLNDLNIRSAVGPPRFCCCDTAQPRYSRIDEEKIQITEPLWCVVTLEVADSKWELSRVVSRRP